jgi:hypothetical protein
MQVPSRNPNEFPDQCEREAAVPRVDNFPLARGQGSDERNAARFFILPREAVADK